MFRNITSENVVRFLITVVAISLIGMLLYYFSNLVVYVLIATFFTYLLDPLVSRMQAAGMNRTFSITLTLAVLTLLLVWVSTSFIPIIAGQMGILANQLSLENIRMIAREMEQMAIGTFEFLPPGFLIENVTQLSENLFDTGRIPALMSNLIGLFTNLFAAFLIIPFATFFFLKDGYRIRRDLLKLVPNNYFETILNLIDKVETSLGRYFRSVLIQSTLVGFFGWLFLSIAGLSNSVSVGVTIGVANTIPYFGPIIGYILSVIVSIIETGDFSLILPCLLAVFIVQLLDNIVFQPLIFSRAANMHPVAILFIIMIGAQTAGMIGMLVAIPIATTIKITISQVIWNFHNYRVYRKNRPEPGVKEVS
ncbi:MAG: AI-2E family transporter [Balneolaceae bacterium]